MPRLNPIKAIFSSVVNWIQLNIIPNLDAIGVYIVVVGGVVALVLLLIRVVRKNDHHGGPKSGCGHRLPGSKLSLIRRIINGSRRFGKMVFQN
jgi:hypothetical protein